LEFPLDTLDERVLIVGVMVHFRGDKGDPIQNRKYVAASLEKAILVREGKIVPFIYPREETPVPQTASQAVKVAWKLK